MILFLIALPALGFGGWPVIARFAGTTAAWTNVILMSVTALCMLGYNAPAMRAESVDSRQFVIMASAALLNSAALVAFGVLLGKYPQYVPIAQALMPVVTVVGSAVLLGERLTWNNGIGIALIAAGIYMVARK